MYSSYIPIVESTVLNDQKRCDLCNGKLARVAVAQKDKFHTIYIYKCDFCGAEYDFKVHAYSPFDCPRHIWIFSHREFYDNQWSHSIEMVFKCDRCGQEKRVYQDSYHSGFSGRVEIDDPRVIGTVVLNKSVAKQLTDNATFNEFYKDMTDEPKGTIIV